MKPCTSSIVVALATLALAACSGTAPRQVPVARTVKPEPVAAPAPAKPAVDPRGNPETRFQTALQLMKDGKRDEARAAFDGLAHDFPQLSGPLSDLGVLQAHDKQYDAAIASFASAVSANARNGFAWGWLGVLHRERGAYAQAEQAYRKAIEARPDDAVAHFNLGILYDVYLHRPADALAQYREYQRLGGDPAATDKLIVAVWIRQIENGTLTSRAASAEGAP
jgi:Flp pilus assembly protein TadD